LSGTQLAFCRARPHAPLACAHSAPARGTTALGGCVPRWLRHGRQLAAAPLHRAVTAPPTTASSLAASAVLVPPPRRHLRWPRTVLPALPPPAPSAAALSSWFRISSRGWRRLGAQSSSAAVASSALESCVNISISWRVVAPSGAKKAASVSSTATMALRALARPASVTKIALARGSAG